MKYIKHEDMGHFNHGWLDTYHHFSFGEYYNEERMNFGPLRVVNDDIINAHQGFPKHPHKDMEIISYVIDGGLTHGDSMGHEETVHRGEVQYMSAGTGVYHSEYNHGDEAVRLLQIWVFPDGKNHTPQYGDFRFNWDDRLNKWLHLVGTKAPIQIHADVNFYVSYFDHEMDFVVEKDRQAYIIQIENDSKINEIVLKQRDALEVTEGSYHFEAEKNSHVLIIEMKRE
jgi:redox-sensitive bicupin YhaK (pirin superfamily)